MAFTCCCTNQCPACGQCCQVDCGHRRAPSGYTVPVVPYTPQRRPEPRPVDIRIIQPKPPLTEDDLKRLIQEGIKDALEELRALRDGDGA